MNTNFNLLFYLKKPKSWIRGPIPIYMRITVDGKRAELASGRECDPLRWSSAAGRCIGNKEEAKILNTYLDTLQTKIRHAQQALLDSGEKVSAETLKNRLTGKTEKGKYLMQIFKEHNQRMKSLIGNGFEANTLKGYNTSVKHLSNFLKVNYGKSDIEIQKLNHAFIVDLNITLNQLVSAAVYQRQSTLNTLKRW